MERNKRAVRALAIGAALLAAASLGGTAARAANTSWNLDPATPGDFDIPANWTNGVPSTSANYQSGTIENGGTVLLNIALPFSIAGLTLDGGSVMDQSAGTLTSTTPGVQVNTGKYILEGTGVLNTGVAVGAPLAGDGSVVSEFDMLAGSVYSLSVGRSTGTAGVFNLTGGTVTNSLALANSGGTGYVVQNGGAVNGQLTLGSSGQGAAYYTLNEGTINVSQLQLLTPTAVFTQTGGSVSAASYIVNKAGATYTLSGGSFSADNFTDAGETFTYSGGTMAISQTASIKGTLDFAGAATELTLGAGGYFDFSGANLMNAGNATLSAGADALVILPSGFDPQTAFAGYNNAGWTHVLGTTFVIPAGRTFTPPVRLLNTSSSPSAAVFADPVDVSGTFATPLGQGMNLYNGLIVRAGAAVDLGTGNLFAETAATFRFEGGSVTAGQIQAGYVYGQGTTPAVVTQAGGTVSTPSLTVNGGNYLLQGGQLNVTAGTLQDNTHSTILQSGGDAYFEQLTAQGTGTYTLSGGTLTIGTDMTFSDPNHNGPATLDFADGSAILKILNDATVNLSGASILNSPNATILVGQGATIEFPASFDPLTMLANYQTGLSLPAQPPTVYVTSGQTLQIGIENSYLDVAGAVVGAPGITASINQGLFVHDGGSVNINGGITVPDGSSGISGGSVTANTLSVGSGGTGLFTQSGGVLSAGLSLDDGGNYVMTGGTIAGTFLEVGTDAGGASFSQTGGTVELAGAVTLNNSSTAAASTYALGGSGVVHAFSLGVGRAGLFNETGGTLTLDSGASVSSSDATHLAVYQISGGSFTTPTLTLNDNGRFQQTGGSITVNSLLSIGTGQVYADTANYTISGGSLYAEEMDLGESNDSQGIGTQPDGYLELNGGQVDVGWLRLFASGYIRWTAGNLNVDSLQFAGNGSLVGTIDMGHQAGTVTINNAFVDLRGGGRFINAQGVDLVFGPNTLVLLPSNFDPTVFHSLTSQGVNATGNNPLTIPAGTTLTLGGHIESYLNSQGITLIVKGNLLGFSDPDKPVLDVSANMSISAGANVNLGVIPAYQVINGIEDMVGGLNASKVDLNGGSLINGNLSATYISFDSTTQNSGTLTASVFETTSSGGYLLRGTGVVQSDVSIIGLGTMTQSAGTHTTSHLTVDSDYVLSGGTLQAHDAIVGEWSDENGFFLRGGLLSASNQLILGDNGQAVGTMTVTGGSIQTPTLILGNQGNGILNASAGSIQVTGTGDALILGNAVNVFNPFATKIVTTTITINGGALAVPDGTSEIGLAANANFTLQSGSFSTQRMVLGENGTATASQSGGTLNVAQALYVGPSTGLHSAGETPDTLTLSGGALTAGQLIVGQNGPGKLAITSATASVTVSQGILFGPYAQFSAVNGATIDMTGSDFQVESTDPALLASLENLTLDFEGGPDVNDTLEAFSLNNGVSGTGLLDLIVGDNSHLTLLDLFDNNPSAPGADVLYVDQLSLASGSSLEISGTTTLYYDQLSDDGGTLLVDPGAQLVHVPEPSTLLLMQLALAGLMVRRPKRTLPRRRLG